MSEQQLIDAVASVIQEDVGSGHLITKHTLAEARSAERETAETHAPGPDALRVLVAEDNEVNQKVAVRMLERMNCSVDVVPNGRDAVERFAAGHQYDIVFMDCHMPDMDGFTATEQIRDFERDGARVPILALTASVMQEDRERCFDAGMDDFLTKPISRSELEAAVAKWSGKVNGE